tara:strand:- start:41832 stop:42140 length:309 start_codon:yes stop_codon:yes gene_type:complete
MNDFPKLDFSKIKKKYPDSGIYYSGKKVDLMTFSFVRVDGGLRVCFFVGVKGRSGGTFGALSPNGCDALSSECFIPNAEYCALIDGDLVNIETEALEHFTCQ